MDRFHKLAERYRDRIYTFARYTLGDRDAAEDVAQEVLIRLWQHRESVETARMGAWVMRVTRNLCIDTIRRRRTEVMVTDQGTLEQIGREEATSSDDPQADVEAVEFRERLDRLLRQISEPHRSIVIMREIEEYSYGEIATALELPLNTVKVYLHRGRRMLRELWAESAEADR